MNEWTTLYVHVCTYMKFLQDFTVISMAYLLFSSARLLTNRHTHTHTHSHGARLNATVRCVVVRKEYNIIAFHHKYCPLYFSTHVRQAIRLMGVGNDNIIMSRQTWVCAWVQSGCNCGEHRDTRKFCGVESCKQHPIKCISIICTSHRHGFAIGYKYSIVSRWIAIVQVM